MEIETVWGLYFSPTGGGQRAAMTIVENVSQRLRVPFELVNLNRPAERKREYVFSASDFLIIVCPTYAGKLPNKILPDLQAMLRGANTPAAPVVMYGNRAFDNALAELHALLSERGFCPIGAAALVSRHAFTDALAYGRPNVSDALEIRTFAARLADTLAQSDALPPSVTVPGDPAAPYYVPKGLDGQPVNFLKAKPKVHPLRCRNCGACARRCPMGAIDPDDVTNIRGVCIKCQACVRLCTRQARSFDDPGFLSHVAALERDYAAPKENQFFT